MCDSPCTLVPSGAPDSRSSPEAVPPSPFSHVRGSSSLALYAVARRATGRRDPARTRISAINLRHLVLLLVGLSCASSLILLLDAPRLQPSVSSRASGAVLHASLRQNATLRRKLGFFCKRNLPMLIFLSAAIFLFDKFLQFQEKRLSVLLKDI